MTFKLLHLSMLMCFSGSKKLAKCIYPVYSFLLCPEECKTTSYLGMRIITGLACFAALDMVMMLAKTVSLHSFSGYH